MRIFALLHGLSRSVERIDQLCRQSINHGLSGASSCVGHHPSDSERSSSIGANIHRDLVGLTTNASRSDFNRRRDVLQSGLENFQSRGARLLLGNLHCRVENVLRLALLAVKHHSVDEPRAVFRVVDRIRKDQTLRGLTFTRHDYFFFPAAGAAPALGFLVPYLDRPCIRLFVPAVCWVPRTM